MDSQFYQLSHQTAGLDSITDLPDSPHNGQSVLSAQSSNCWSRCYNWLAWLASQWTVSSISSVLELLVKMTEPAHLTQDSVLLAQSWNCSLRYNSPQEDSVLLAQSCPGTAHWDDMANLPHTQQCSISSVLELLEEMTEPTHLTQDSFLLSQSWSCSLRWHGQLASHMIVFYELSLGTVVQDDRNSSPHTG